MSILENVIDVAHRGLGGGGDDGGHGFGVHIQYNDLWLAMVYLAGIYIFGFMFERVLFCPALVGQIAAGIVLGPQVADIVPYTKAFVLLGEIGLVLLVIEAGVDIDVTTLKLIGKRGVIIATLGSILPIVIGIAIAYALGADTKAAIAAGASFGPTSLGIAMNILKTGKIINTPTGQLIVAAAIIDDMIALIILSQLGGLVGEITISGVLVPIVSALAFLIIGGYLALFILPDLLDRFIFAKKNMSENTHGKIALTIMLALVLGLMQAAHYTKASHLMGAFIAGLVFCTDHELHVTFVSQFKRVLQWLMRIFFASTIGFQVPVTQFGNGKVVWQGLLFTLALLGKLVVGFMVPNFTHEKKFTGNHLRDCLIVGCSMAAEGEFAFVIAAFAVDKDLIDKDLYSSIVLAILLSTIIAPFSLRFTITYFNKRAMAAVVSAEKEMTTRNGDEELTQEINAGTAVFYCINTTSHAAWGTLPALMHALFDLQLEVIDHRSWHTRFESTVINEVYVKGVVKKDANILDEMRKVNDLVKVALNQDEAVIVVSQWLPGIVGQINEGSVRGEIGLELTKEAQKNLDISEHQGKRESKLGKINETFAATTTSAPTRRKRVRIVSTPVGGGDMFVEGGEGGDLSGIFQPSAPVRNRRRRVKTMSTPISGDMWGDTTTVILGPDEVLVNILGDNDEKFPAKMTKATYKLLTTGEPMLLTKAQEDTQFTGQFLDGFVRGHGRRTRSISNISIDENNLP